MGEREKFAAEMAELDRRRDAEIEQAFIQETGLEEAIRVQIIPAVERLNIDGICGTALVFAPGWIVSNSHVVAELAALQSGRFANRAISPDAERAFFRPKKLGNYPDIMIAKIGEYEGVRAIPNPLAIDALYEPVRYFTIDYRYEDPIRWLTHHEDALGGYSTFSFEDGDLPSQGLSGSPIMAARLRKEAKTPTWSFSLHSLVFAYKADTNNLCSMPIEGDLLQLQGVMFAKAVQERAEDSIFGSHNSAFSWTAKQAESSYNYALHAYRQGEGASPIDLPPNLEPLFGNEVMPIACSLLLEQRLAVPKAGKGEKQPGSKKSARATKSEDRGQSEMGTLSFEELETDRDSVYEDLKDNASELDGGKYIKVSEQADSNYRCVVAQSTWFHIDYEGSLKSGCYKFALQDNIKDKKGAPIQINHKAASSTFAMAKIYTESVYISLDKIFKVLQQSEKKAAYFYKRNHADTLCSSAGSTFVEAMARQYGDEVGTVDIEQGTLCLKAKNDALQNSKRFDKDENSVFVGSPVMLRGAAP